MNKLIIRKTRKRRSWDCAYYKGITDGLAFYCTLESKEAKILNDHEVKYFIDYLKNFSDDYTYEVLPILLPAGKQIWEIWLEEVNETGTEGARIPELLDIIISDTFENAVIQHYKKMNSDVTKLRKFNDRHLSDYYSLFPTFEEALTPNSIFKEKRKLRY